MVSLALFNMYLPIECIYKIKIIRYRRLIKYLKHELLLAAICFCFQNALYLQHCGNKMTYDFF